jgi:hypothetical protein
VANLKAEKIKAGKLLTAQLKSILQEKTEVEMDEDGTPVIVTKAEKMARTMVKLALGYKEEVERKMDGKTVIDELVHGPNVGMIALVYDRVEGRIPVAAMEEPDKRTLADRVSDQGKKRINAISGAQGGTDQTRPNPETQS